MMEGDGYIDVAEFVTVVSYDKTKFPNGVRKFKSKETVAETPSPPTEGGIAPPAWTANS